MVIYLSKEHLSNLKPSWQELSSLIEKALVAVHQGDFSQPIKPYLRYRDPSNRIIAMPAFIGGEFNVAGIKWIASFPNNIKKNLPRAHALTILNNYESGKPLAILSANELSGLRTAAVSGYIIQKFLNKLPKKKLKVGITGFGPIGQLHAEMISEILKSRLDKIRIYDIQSPLNKMELQSQYDFVSTWQEAYIDADIFISCTTSKKPYINQLPKNSSLQLNVSLRDYFANIVKQSSLIIVDDWEEVCRENTDIERASLEFGLCEANTISLKQLTQDETFRMIEKKNILSNGFISFHFMGMAFFDIALSSFFYEQASKEKIGMILPD
ncbi:hypothetical protein [Candidatus Protochlamydia sp. W-9]|uniref:hypothetical protein n=1 Tax=Candidatus Protochlamydia sp. W-9 TaxID=1785087 RepID=UPI00096A728B|nr:hypothetical protein [Candidatus Protochlamydia sp. W-9]